MEKEKTVAAAETTKAAGSKKKPATMESVLAKLCSIQKDVGNSIVVSLGFVTEDDEFVDDCLVILEAPAIAVKAIINLEGVSADMSSHGLIISFE